MRLIRMIGLVMALALCGMLPATAAVWGPVLGNPSPTSMQIGWKDGLTPAKGVLFDAVLRAGSVDHGYRLVTLTGLEPDTKYTYQFVEERAKQQYTFRTPPRAPAPITFAVIGDTRSGHDVHRKLTAAMRAIEPRFVINTGDAVADGKRADDWDTFFQITAPLTATVPYFIAPGNHEGNADYLYRLFPAGPGEGAQNREWYSVTYGPVRVIMLNSTHEIAAQRKWLERTLPQRPDGVIWTVVSLHYPPYSSSARGGDAQMREQWVPLFEKHGVDAVFLGHDHFYERSEKNGITYFICGGGGAPLYDPNVKDNPYQRHAERVNQYLRVEASTHQLQIRMIRLNGTVGDEVTLMK